MSQQNRAVVLMADDDADDRALTKEAFEENNVSADLRFVTDGEELMDYLHGRGEYAEPGSAPMPELILLDLNMPRKDGREALREMKSDPRLKNIRVVVLTTSQEQIDVSAAYDLSATSYIHKPNTFDALVDVVRAIGEYWLGTVMLPTPVHTHGFGPCGHQQ